ncbi:MAG: CsgG/HfaB family protein [Methylobacter sp.]|nr:CsgG/HfaB family protein [Methylococcales bacterium]MDD5113635.1 CsgG/HfaB family protein [Methylobacter sp.]
MIAKPIRELSLLVSVLALSGCPQPGLQTGGSSNLLTGSAGGSTSINANKSLERCASPLGTLAVSDGRFSGSSSVTTVDPLIRLAVQQSNCFVITSIGNQATRGLINDIVGEQRDSGEYRAGSKQEKGQRVAADYLLDPQIIVLNENTSGGNAGLGGALLGAGLGAAGLSSIGALAGAVSGAVETRTTDVALTLTDIRSTVQVAISQGSSTANNMSGSGSGAFGGWSGLFAGATGGSLGAYSRTPEGIATAAAFFDAYNNMVQSVKNYKAQDVKGGMGQGGQLKVN